jgi:hypothetical protein
LFNYHAIPYYHYVDKRTLNTLTTTMPFTNESQCINKLYPKKIKIT